MTWEVLLVRVADTAAPAATLRAEEVLTLGRPQEVRDMLQRAAPGLTFASLAIATLPVEDGAMTLSLGEYDPVRGVLLLAPSASAAARVIVSAMCALTGWRAFDTHTEEFLTP